MVENSSQDVHCTTCELLGGTQLLIMVIDTVAIHMGRTVTAEFLECSVPELKHLVVNTFGSH